MPEVHQKSTYDVPVSVAFTYVDDPTNVPKWMFGVSSFEPQKGSPATGLGAVYDVVFSVKPVKIKTTMRVAEWVENELLRFETVKGFFTESTWKFGAAGESRSTLEVDFRYELPGGLAGKAMGKALEPIVGLSVKESERTLAKHMAAL